MQHCLQNAATLREPAWFMMLNICSKIGKVGIALAHEYSKDYPGYSHKETQEKFRHAFRNSYPASCDAIQDVFTCPKRCGVRTPLELHRKEQSQKCVVTQSFQSKEDGIYYSPSQWEKDDAMFVCTPLRIVGKARMPDRYQTMF